MLPDGLYVPTSVVYALIGLSVFVLLMWAGLVRKPKRINLWGFRIEFDSDGRDAIENQDENPGPIARRTSFRNVLTQSRRRTGTKHQRCLWDE
jgi:hypothetical protein